MGNFVSLRVSQESTGTFLLFFWEVYRTISRSDTQYYGRRRSLVRFIGSLLSKQIKLPPRVTIHPTARLSMYKATTPYQKHPLGERTFKDTELDQKSVIHVKPDVVADLYPIFEKGDSTPEKYKSTKKIADLEQKLNELNYLVQQLLATSNTISNPTPTVVTPTAVRPPPPPPPLPADIPVIPSAKIPKSKKKPATNVKHSISMCDILKDMNKVQLRRVERSPGGHPIKRPKTPQPADSLSEILKRRFAAIQLSPECQIEIDF